MATTQKATRIRRTLSAVGLLPVSFVVWRAIRELSPALLVRNYKLRKANRGAIPIPPGNLIFSATGTHDVQWFLESGVQTTTAFRNALASIGRSIESFSDIFELGCGCGRVLRQWKDVEGPRFHASDYNPRGVNWGRRHLAFVSFATNKLAPPLPFPDNAFDLCYAVSVFTHLPEELQLPWLNELRRVLRPNAILLLTLSGEADLVRTTAEEQKRFHDGELVVLDERFAGTNMCGVYHPESYVRKHWAELFEILKFMPQGASGSPFQDLYVLQRK